LLWKDTLNKAREQGESKKNREYMPRRKTNILKKAMGELAVYKLLFLCPRESETFMCRWKI